MTIKNNALFLSLLLAFISGCTIEPIRNETKEIIKDAPAWVNNGSRLEKNKAGRFFHGVSRALPQGDLALQKSIADDASVVEVGKVLTGYLDAVSNSYMTVSREGDNSGNKPGVYRDIDTAVTHQVTEAVQHQIDEAIARQYKDKDQVSAKFKSEITRQVNDTFFRQIKNTISYNTDFYSQLEDEITRQIKGSVVQEIKITASVHLPAVKIIDSWRDTNTKIIWSLSELDLKSLKSSMNTLKDLNVDLKTYFDNNAENIFDGMIQERDNVTPFFLFK